MTAGFGFVTAVLAPSALGIASAAILIGAGVAISTPLGFAERGDAGGPILVGLYSPISLGIGLLALAAAVSAAAASTWSLTRAPSATRRA